MEKGLSVKDVKIDLCHFRLIYKLDTIFRIYLDINWIIYKLDSRKCCKDFIAK